MRSGFGGAGGIVKICKMAPANQGKPVIEHVSGHFKSAMALERFWSSATLGEKEANLPPPKFRALSR